MHTTLPQDCGNSPRNGIVTDLVVAWAEQDSDVLAGWSADHCLWLDMGGEDVAVAPPPPMSADRLEVTSVVTHGRLASADGILDDGTRRVAFAHTFRFTGAGKRAKVAEVRSYFVDHPQR